MWAAAAFSATSAFAVPRPLSTAERAELEVLARSLFDAVRAGEAEAPGVFPSPAELREVFGVREVGDAGSENLLVARQRAAIVRDVRELRSVLAGAEYVGLAGPPRTTVDARRCGRFGVQAAPCADGPVVEYRIGLETHRFRVDTLVRVGGRWRVFDLRF